MKQLLVRDFLYVIEYLLLNTPRDKQANGV